MTPSEEEGMARKYMRYALFLGRKKAAKYGLDPEEGESVALVGLAKAVKTWEVGHCPETAWVVRLVKQALCDASRKEGRQRRAVEAVRDLGGSEDFSLTLEGEGFGWADAERALRVGCKRAPAEHWEVLAMVAQGWEYERIARATGEPMGTVKSRIHRARSVLMEALGRGGNVPSIPGFF